MTYFEAKIQLDTDQDLNQVASAVLSALYAADIDALGVQVQQFDTAPVYDIADDEDYNEVVTFGGQSTCHPTPRDIQPQYAKGGTIPRETLADVPDDSYTAELLANLKKAHKQNGDRYHG